MLIPITAPTTTSTWKPAIRFGLKVFILDAEFDTPRKAEKEAEAACRLLTEVVEEALADHGYKERKPDYVGQPKSR